MLTCPSVRERKADMASTTNVVECTAMDFVSKKLIYSGIGEYMGLGDEDTLRGSVSAALETLWRAGGKVSAASVPSIPTHPPQEQEKALYAAYPYSRLVFPQTNEVDPQFRAVMDERRAMIKAEAKRWLKSDHPDATGAQADYLYREYLAKLSQQYGHSWFPNADLAVSGAAISIPEPTIRTTASTAAVAGRVVSKGATSSLTVDGREAPIGSDGTFSFQRSVPVGESAIKLVATDEWGQRGEATIKVIRSIASTIPDYPALSPAKVKAKPRPNAVALVVGVDGYQNIPRAEFAENDARYFYDYAINALGVPKDRIKLLTGAEARKLDVEKALLTWLKPLVAGGKSDVFIFFSGHGLASDDGRDLFLLPYDGDRSLLDRSAIRRKELVDAIVGAGAASATLFLDTCYSGGTRSGETLVASARPVLLAAKEEAVPANVTILTAAANDQLSSTLPATGHGLFSYYLMRGLEGEASGGGRAALPTRSTISALFLRWGEAFQGTQPKLSDG